MTPAPSLDVRGPSPASPGGAPLAPRPRRVDYLLAAAVGVAAAPATMVLLGTASSLAAADRLPLAVLHLALALTVCAAAQWFFAVRSSLGGLAAGLVALVAQVAVLLSPQGSQSAPTPWARTFIPTGTLLIAAGVLLGGSWGMRYARRAGRDDARLAVRLTAADRTMGVTPSAPPSRRRDHGMSLIVTAATTVAALALLQHGYADLVGPLGDSASPVDSLTTLGALVLLALGAFVTGRSTLGARATGPLLGLAGLPALLGGARPAVPGTEALVRWLPHDPTGVGLIATGILLTTVGWGAHLARHRSRAEELVGLRPVEPTTPALGAAHSQEAS